MSKVYSLHEAKAKFSQIIRAVRSGKHVRITYRGEEVAEVVPIRNRKQTSQERIRELEQRGVITPAKDPHAPLRPLVDKEIPGALQRFLDERE